MCKPPSAVSSCLLQSVDWLWPPRPTQCLWNCAPYYVELPPEQSEVNFSRVPTSSLRCLKTLISCHDRLPRIHKYQSNMEGFPINLKRRLQIPKNLFKLKMPDIQTLAQQMPEALYLNHFETFVIRWCAPHSAYSALQLNISLWSCAWKLLWNHVSCKPESVAMCNRNLRFRYNAT